jgi:hypothetical protein
MLVQLKKCSTRSRDRTPIFFSRSGSSRRLLIAEARSCANLAGSFGSKSAGPDGSKGTRSPVFSGMTTSMIPPTAEATTGVPHAIASRLMIPNGS